MGIGVPLMHIRRHKSLTPISRYELRENRGIRDICVVRSPLDFQTSSKLSRPYGGRFEITIDEYGGKHVSGS